MMDRRSFLHTLIASGALYSTGALPGLIRTAQAADFPVLDLPLLVSVLLSGGPDFRYLLPPAYDTEPGSFGNRYWHANAACHELEADDSALQLRWDNDYHALSDGDTSFGMLKSCGWLKRMWDQGNVAIINNVLTTSSRNHPHSILVTEQGNRAALPNHFDVPGWGGQLAASASRNVLSLTPVPRHFCYNAPADGSGGRTNEHMISAVNTRAISLFAGSPDDDIVNRRAVITRSVSSYYNAKRDAFLGSRLAARFAEHEARLREFGQPITERLSTFPLPDAISRLYDPLLPALNDREFGHQIRNLYDSLACADIFNMGMAALEYRGWDSHRVQKQTIEPRLQDLFGDGRAFDALFSELPPSVVNNLVITFHGEFGRQIRANGDGGTDHGEGATMLVIGAPVNGGIYGNPYPVAELARLDDVSPQVTGETGIDVVCARLAEWFSTGSATAIFPDLAAAPVETGLNLESLFT